MSDPAKDLLHSHRWGEPRYTHALPAISTLRMSNRIAAKMEPNTLERILLGVTTIEQRCEICGILNATTVTGRAGGIA